MISYFSRRLLPHLLFFIILEACVRASLVSYSWSDITGDGAILPLAFLTGLGFDICVFFYVVLIPALYAACLPSKFQGSKADRICSTIIFFAFVYILTFSATGEWLFWDEFQTRYNFIAVDYLVYTTEVIGNIHESYPVGWLMSGMALIAGGLSYAYYKYTAWLAAYSPATIPARVGGFAVIILICAASFFGIKGSYAEISQNRYVNDIARNGVYELFSAYVNNELDYDHFYIRQPDEKVAAFVKKELGVPENAEHPLERRINNKSIGREYNLIMITVESLSAAFLAEFGDKTGVTPNLDALIPESLFFSNLYATGRRTVYGLAALSLSMPPVPGNSIVRRPDNGDLYTLGSALAENGYDTKFIYGGFGYFDNMNAFFSANGYKIVDRANLKKEEIGFANVWGVSDEDLFRRVLKESDEAYGQKKPFFNMVMTTSNHRPYTFPEGRIDLPQGGRRSGVKYSDWAIGYFLKEAKTRPWFKDTIFVIVADHTAGSSGKSDLDPSRHKIPMWVYAPGIIKPGRVDWMTSQIDVAPTVLGLMGIDYDSRFYGKDVMKEKPERVFISNYQKLGYMTEEGLVVLQPMREARFYKPDGEGHYLDAGDVPQDMLDKAIGYYQGASEWRIWSRREKPAK